MCVCVTSDLPAARRKYHVVQAWTPKQYSLRGLNGGEDIYEITDMSGSLVTVIPCLTRFRANLYYTGQESNTAQANTVKWFRFSLNFFIT